MPNIILILSVDFNILDSKALWTRVSFKTSNVGFKPAAELNKMREYMVLKHQMWILNVRSPHSKQFQGEF